MAMQSQHFSSPQTRSGRHSLNSCKALSAVYTAILHPCSLKLTQRVFPSIHQRTSYIFTLLWSHTTSRCICTWLCECKTWWSLVMFGRQSSPLALFCTKLLLHGNSIIKSRWPLTTKIVNSSFYCMYIAPRGVGTEGPRGPRPPNILTGWMAWP